MTQSRRKSNDKIPLRLTVASPASGGASSSPAPTDRLLMNELQSACGRNDKAVRDRILFDLKARHDSFVMNMLSREKVPAADRESVSGRVWETIGRVAGKPQGVKGAWDPDRGLDGGCPFVPLLSKVCSSRARDYHDAAKTQRRRLRHLEEATKSFGDAWQSKGGTRAKPAFPRKRGGNLKQAQPPAGWKVVAAGERLLATAMAGLPERQRRALELHAEGMNNEEIALIIGTSSPTVSRDLTEARTTIRRLAEAAAG